MASSERNLDQFTLRNFLRLTRYFVWEATTVFFEPLITANNFIKTFLSSPTLVPITTPIYYEVSWTSEKNDLLNRPVVVRERIRCLYAQIILKEKKVCEHCKMEFANKVTIVFFDRSKGMLVCPFCKRGTVYNWPTLIKPDIMRWTGYEKSSKSKELSVQDNFIRLLLIIERYIPGYDAEQITGDIFEIISTMRECGIDEKTITKSVKRWILELRFASWRIMIDNNVLHLTKKNH